MSLQCDNLSGELQDQWSSSFTVNFVFENVICKVKHFTWLVHALALRLCDTFGMLLYMEIVNNKADTARDWSIARFC